MASTRRDGGAPAPRPGRPRPLGARPRPRPPPAFTPRGQGPRRPRRGSRSREGTGAHRHRPPGAGAWRGGRCAWGLGGTARAGAAGPAGAARLPGAAGGDGASGRAERGSLALTQGCAPGAAFLKLENTPHLPSPPGPSPRPGIVMSAGPRPRRRRAASGRRAPAGTDGPGGPPSPARCHRPRVPGALLGERARRDRGSGEREPGSRGSGERGRRGWGRGGGGGERRPCMLKSLCKKSQASPAVEIWKRASTGRQERGKSHSVKLLTDPVDSVSVASDLF